MLARVERKLELARRPPPPPAPSFSDWYASLPREEQELVASFARRGIYSIERHRGPRRAVELIPSP